MPRLVLFAIDLVAVCVLVFGLYFPRHRRRDLVVAYLGVNVGVLAVAGSLSGGTVGAGLGLGLFGVLSIIRLRSTELDQPALIAQLERILGARVHSAAVERVDLVNETTVVDVRYSHARVPAMIGA